MNKAQALDKLSEAINVFLAEIEELPDVTKFLSDELRFDLGRVCGLLEEIDAELLD